MTKLFAFPKRRFRTALCLALVFSLLCLGAPLPARAVRFSDVPRGSWYEASVTELVNRGVLKGTTPTTFSPGGTLTRAEFATMLARTALTEQELAQYNYRGDFSDVAQNRWYNKYINWAYEAGVIKGQGQGKFGPGRPVTRQDMAVMVMNFATATGQVLPARVASASFSDYGSISGYAASSVMKCQRGGVINGYKDGTFRPKRTATRAEAAKLYATFLDYVESAGYKLVHKRINGTAVAAVEFDPKDFTPGVTMGHNYVRGGENVTSVINRTGAKILVNAAFFDMSTYDPYGTHIQDGRLATVYNDFSPAKSAVTMDGGGNFSIENFSVDISATLTRADGSQSTVSKVGCNRYPADPKDGTRMVFTREWWGQSLGFAPKYAAVVNPDGLVTAVYKDTDVSLPQSGFVLAQRGARGPDDDFLTTVKAGDWVDLEIYYNGSSTQDIQMAVAVGPKIVENGRPYGDESTYRAEGFRDPGIIYYDARRACVGIKPDGKLVILTAYTNLSGLANIMVAMGCDSAVNLDGGGSTNLYVNGVWLYGPQSRPLNSILYFR